MPDLDFVPLQRTPVAAARFAARPATHAPERPAEPAGVRAVALARLDAPAAGDDEARAAGAAPVRRGEPGYGPHLDRDNDC
ncbi:excalibur calcium-binding domain-containing protein, partial [Cellulomonas iranensis]|uniref:excalibur calcium-binding domain-containing protein n=1 Tax=Cellulomonas iranensis TaxID=76862 RepID=UPI0023F576E0